MRDQFFLTLCGICNDPNDPNGWWALATQWLVRHGYAKSGNAVHFAYGVGPLEGPHYDDWLAGLVAPYLEDAAADGMDLNLIGHSNGCKITNDILRLRPGLKFRTVHEIAAADSEDCEKNGLNRAAQNGQVGKVVLYVSPLDEALGIGTLLRYGPLGKVGPRNIAPELRERMGIVTEPMHHSQWLTDLNWMMRQIVAGVVQ